MRMMSSAKNKRGAIITRQSSAVLRPCDGWGVERLVRGLLLVQMLRRGMMLVNLWSELRLWM